MKHNFAIAMSVFLAIVPLNGALSQKVAPATARKGSPKGLRTPETIIKRLDRDGDGRVSRAEFRKSLPSMQITTAS